MQRRQRKLKVFLYASSSYQSTYMCEGRFTNTITKMTDSLVQFDRGHATFDMRQQFKPQLRPEISHEYSKI